MDDLERSQFALEANLLFFESSPWLPVGTFLLVVYFVANVSFKQLVSTRPSGRPGFGMERVFLFVCPLGQQRMLLYED